MVNNIAECECARRENWSERITERYISLAKSIWRKPEGVISNTDIYLQADNNKAKNIREIVD